MPLVRVEPLGREFDASPNETLMQAANRAGLYWPTICGGNGYCNRCVFTIDPYDESVAPMEKPEREALVRVRWRNGEKPGERLACQVMIVSDVTIYKKGVAPLC
jgi:ferredoxin, 2Fe-2S